MDVKSNVGNDTGELDISLFLCYVLLLFCLFFFFFQAEDGIRDLTVTGVQTCAFRSETNDQYSDESNYSWADNLSWIHGKHAIRTGVFIIRSNENHLDLGRSRGKINFQNFTDFLLGDRKSVV